MSTLTLGLDPGLAPTGWGLVRRAGSVTSYVAHGVLRTDPALDTHARVQALAAGLGVLLTTYRPDAVAIERWVHYGQSETTRAHDLGLVVGALVAAAGAAGVPTLSVSRAQDWRRALGMDPSATKTQAQHRVRMILGLADLLRPQHANDATAVAIVAARDTRPLARAPASLRGWAGRGEVRLPVPAATARELRTLLAVLAHGGAREVSAEVAGVVVTFVAPGGGAP